MAQSMFSITTNVKAYTRKMNRVNKELLPKAIGNTLNRACSASHSRSIRNLKGDLILRNQYTERSMILQLSKYKPGRSIARINATTGSKSPYLPIQETGGVVRAKRSRIPVPTLAGRKGKWRRPVPPALRMNRMGKIGTAGSKFFFMRSPGGKKGIFYRKPKTKIVRVRDISKRSYRIKARKWHSEAVGKYGNKRIIGQMFVQEAKRQLGKLQ